MKKRIFLNIFLFTLLINLISAADVAYIYNKDYKVDQNVIDIFEELGMSVKLVKDKDVPRTNFDDFHMIFVGDGLFPGGNDYSVYEAGFETIAVKGPEETAVIIKQWIS